MKHVLKIFVLSFIIKSCTQNNSKNYLTFSGEIKNRTCDSIIIKAFGKKKGKIIKLDKNGYFKDTLNAIEKTYYGLYIGDFWKKIYIQNGDDIYMTLDVSDLNKTITFSGKGVEKIHFIQKFKNSLRTLYEEKHIHNLPEIEFTKIVNQHFHKLTESLQQEKTFDSIFVTKQQNEMQYVLKNIKKEYQKKQLIKKALVKGSPSPSFINYTNHKGSTSSLYDFKEKYVYIDMWATWCKPCIGEFPSLQKLIEKYKEKNIQFINISIDDKKDFGKWKNYVTENKLKGVQLIISDDKSFKNEYLISNIPRYILIDPDGNIITPNAPSPSNPLLIELFDSLKI